ncbi:MAG: Ig-like domain-containing protein, partial [Pseudomonadota bacterium]
MSITSIPSLIPLFSRTLSAPFGDQFRSVLIADAGSTDIDDLLVGAQQEPHWVFDSNQAIGVITEVLANRDTDTLHIVAHGRARGIRFGGGWLDAGALFDAKELLAQWQVKNIALWSCGLAQDDPFVRMLALFTGARVFSSASALGMVDGLPNWRLDGDDGGFDTPAPPFSAAAIASWPHTLASLSFVNAYAVNTATTAASKEANSVDISFVSRNVARIDDMSGGQNFSGNDVVARLVVDGVEYFGWISRPIKSGGDIKGYYFWSDPSFTSLAAATADSNADGDGNSADNFGFVLVVDQAWFDQQAGTTIKNVGTSSDRVDNGMNALLAVNSAPALVNDSGAFTEDAGAQTGNVLLNDADANLDALTVTGFKIGNVAGTLGAAFNIANVGSFTLLANGAYTFTPVSNHAGTVPLVTYTAADGRGGSSSAYLSINVAQVNDAPSGTSGTISSRENAVYTFGAADFGFSDDLDNPANTLLSVKIATLPDPAKGMLTLNGIAVTSGAFVAVADITRLKFLPVANGTGTGFANFTFQVRDNGGGATDIDLSANTISFDIVDVNSAPLAVNDAASTTEAGGAGNGVTFAAPAGKLLANDTDIDAADTRSVASASGAGTGTTAVATNTVITGSHGVLTLSSDGSYIYTVNNASGAVQAMRTAASTLTDTFTYTMKDGDGLTSTALLTVTIGGSNDSIDAVNDANFAVSSTTAQFRLNPGGNVLRNDGDVDSGDAMSVTRASKGAALSGSPTTIGAGSSASGVEHSTYTTFVVDSAGISPGDIVVVTAGNSSSGYFPVSTTVLSFSAGSKTVTVSDAGYIGAGSALTIGSGLFSVASVGAAHTTKVAIFVATGDGSITNGVGVTGSGIGPGTTVTAVNSAAVSGGTMYQVTLSQALTGALGTNLVFGSAGTTIAGDYGNLLLQNDGSYTYAVTGTTTTGTETFTYEVRDTSGALSTAKLTIGITNATAAAPVLVADSKTISENGSVVSGNLLSNDSGASGLIDAQGSGATFLAASAAGTVVAGRYGTLTVHNAGGQAEGAYAYAVAAGNASVDALNGSQTLTDVFQYRAAGAGGTFAISSLTITINGANDAPLAVNDTATAREAGGADNAAAGLNPAGNVKGNDSDPDNGDSIAVSMAGTSSAAATVAGGSSAANGLTIVGAYGSLKLGADGSFTYAVDNSNAAVQALGLASGGLADTFTYQLRDAAGLTSTATLTLDVLGANDAPVNALNAGATIAQGVAGALAGISVADVDDASITVSLAVVSGVLAIGTLGAAAISAGVNGSARLTLSGSPADINSALATLSYQGGPDFSGTDTLTVTSRDAGALQDIDILDITVSPDNRALTVSSLSVNEASPFAVFTVTGAVGQKVTLALPDIAGAARAAAGADYQSVLDYFDGAAWLPYDGNPVAIPAGGDLFVRIGVLQDTADEGAEAFNLIALNKAGTSVSGTATIYDNGLGIIYDGSIVGGTPATATTGLDDDRAVSVTNISVNENSPYAVFTLTGSASQVVTLAIGNGNASNADHGSAIEYFDGAGWRAYGSSVTLPAGGTLFLRVSITTDSVYEGPESFGIVASNLSGRSYVGTATINDDGRGLVFPGTITAGAIDSAAIGLDNDLAVALVAFGPVNEASAYAMYTVTATAGEVLGLALAGSGSAPATAAGFTLDFSYDGIAWSSYGDATQPIVPAGGLVYVRAAIASEQDTSVEGAETFALTASISSGLGKSASATSTIVDDGSGSRYDGSVSGGLPVADTTGLDQDGDLTPPTIAITASTATLGMGQSATITFTLSEAATDFAVGDVAVSGGSLASFSGSGAIYTATFTPAASSTANGVVSVASGRFADAAGNANADGADSNNTLTMAVNTVAADTTAPTIAISSDASALAVGQSATITFTLSEAASDFVAADVAVSGGILSNFSGSGSSYSATFTPAASSTANGVVSVASGRFADAA